MLKVGQLIAVKYQIKKYHLTQGLFQIHRILKIINKCTILIESPDGKTWTINVNDAKPVSAITSWQCITRI